MQLIKLIILFQFIFGNILFAQNRVMCADFLLDKNTFPKSKSYLSYTSRAFSKLKHPPIVLERDDSTLQVLMNVIKNEDNFRPNEISQHSIPIADYYITCNAKKEGYNNRFILDIDLVSIKKNNAFVKRPLNPIIFTSKEFDDDVTFYLKLIVELDNQIQFDSNLGLIGTEQMNQIDTMRKQIYFLQEQNKLLSQKELVLEKSLSKVNNDIEAIRKYSLIASLNLYGEEIRAGAGISVSKSALTESMYRIFKELNGKIVLKVDCDENNINDAIKINPFFPFSYYAKTLFYIKNNDSKWTEEAQKCIKILEETVKITNHNQNHDQVLEILQNMLKSNAYLKASLPKLIEK